MQVSRGCRDVGVAEEALNDVKVHATADEARSVGVTPPVGKVPTGNARRGPSLLHETVKRPRAVPTTQLPISLGVGEKVRRGWKLWPYIAQVIAKYSIQIVGNRDVPSKSIRSVSFSSSRP